MAAQRIISSFDLLKHPSFTSVIRQEQDLLRIDEPWMSISYGEAVFREGWWKLVCKAGAPVADSEVCLRSPSDPLVVIPTKDAAKARFRFGDMEPRKISLLVSSWPGDYSITELRLVRLGSFEVIAMLGLRALQSLRRGRLIPDVLRYARRRGMPGLVGLRLHDPAGRGHTEEDAEPMPPLQRELVLSGGLHVLVTAGDRIHPNAGKIVQTAFASMPETDVIVADTLEGGSMLPKPLDGLELAASYAYFETPLFFRTPQTSVVAAQKRATEAFQRAGGTTARIALPLAYRPQRLSRELTPTRSPVLTRRPLVSIIIPTKFRTDLLAKCLSSLASRTSYKEKEVLVVDNGSTDPRFGSVVEEAAGDLAMRVLTDTRPFNFSTLVNAAAEKAKGEVVLLLNDDIEAIEPEWLDRMVESAIRADVGVVGARLSYPDGTVQHAGIVLGIGGLCGHLWKHASAAEAGSNPYIIYPQERSAVTGACLMSRKQVFDALGGIDDRFPFNYGDVDYCLRARASGLKVLYRGDAELVHHESKSTGAPELKALRQRSDEQGRRVFFERWSSLLRGDPYSSPAFDPASESGRIRESLGNAWA